MSTIKLPAASGGGSISLKGPSTAGSDTDFLDTSGNLNVTGNLTVDGAKLTVDSDNAYGNIVISRDGGVSGRRPFGIAISGSSDADLRITASNDTNSANAFTTGLVDIQSGGDVSITDGNLKVASGHGIDFSATADGTTMSSELFDDYEEGTFTGVLGGSTNHSTYNISTLNAHYTKVGRVVHVHMNWHNQNLDDSAAGYVKITGLPFAGIGSSGHWSSNFSSYNVGFDTARNQVFYVDGSAAYGLQCRNGASWIDWDVGHFNPGTMYLRLDLTYTTT